MSAELTFEKVWTMFQESDKKMEKIFQEIERQSKDTDKKFQDTDKKFQDTDKKFQDTDRKFQDTDKKFQDTDKKFLETDKLFKESDKKLKKLETLFISQWGKLMESLVEGDLIPLLQARGIKVDQTTQRTTKIYNSFPFEIDIIAMNGEEVVFVEVKTTLFPKHVEHFLEKMNVIQDVFPHYKGKKIYGAMAYLRQESEAAMYAMKQGLYVIRATGKSASIINTTDFTAKLF
jgi:Holliday junction resolvase-like predicted endonuclease